MDKLLGLLGLAFRGRRIDLGEQPVLRAIQERRAVMILIASDAGENTSHRISLKAANVGIPVTRCGYDKNVLGSAFGRTSCAVAAICDAKLAAEITSRLTDQ